MTGPLRTALLILSPRHISVTAKTFVLWRRLQKTPAALAIWNQYFGSGAYRQRYPDVAESNVNPLVHFLLLGNQERRQPCEQFDLSYYLRRYPEVMNSGVNGLLHFALFGSAEGRTLAKTQPVAPAAESPPSESPRRFFINNEWRRDCPLVSVVIPCFNYGPLVEKAIRSVLTQTFSNLEIIVVEGGSTDASTVAEVRRLEALGLPNTFFYYRPERHFAGDNRNFGIGVARGRYICCLDADDELRPVYLEVAVFLAEIFGYDVVTPSVKCTGESDLLWMVPEPHYPDILSENQVATAALFRRSAWAHVGGFRDWGLGQQHVHEDWDFWIRVLGHGFVAQTIREPLLLYRVHSGSLSSGAGLKLDQQRELLQTTNAALIESASVNSASDRVVCNPWANLAATEGGVPGFLLALPFITVGGAEKLFRTLAQRIVASGQRLVIITSLTLSQTMPEDSSSFEEITPNLYHLSKLFSDDATRHAFLRYLIRRYCIETLMIAGCELVYHLLPDLKKEFPQLTVVDQLFNDTVHVFNNRHYSESIDATVVPSEQLQKSLFDRHNADASTVHVIPHGVHRIAEANGEDAGVLPASAANKLVIAFFGRWSEEKAPDLFVEIVRKLAGHRHLSFVMTGDGPLRDVILTRIKKYGLQDRIYSPGFVADVTPLMRAADIVVLPSRIDGMPLAVLEAQALGKPVVASNIGSLPVMIEDGHTGFLCESGDVNAFCERILQLSRDADLRRRMKQAAQQHFEEKHDAERMLDSYARVFQTIRLTSPKIQAAGGDP